MANLIPKSISKNSDLAAYDTMFATRMAGIDYSAVLSNLFDVVPAAALPALALQYGVTGYNGWRYAVTEADQRALLKKAVFLHQYKGTEYSIKEALKMIGLTPVTILKGMYFLYYNNEQYYNGGFLYGAPNPYVIQVNVSQSDFPALTAQNAIDAIAIIYEFKSARDYLVSVNYETITAIESAGVSDVLDLRVITLGVPVDYVL